MFNFNPKFFFFQEPLSNGFILRAGLSLRNKCHLSYDMYFPIISVIEEKINIAIG